MTLPTATTRSGRVAAGHRPTRGRDGGRPSARPSQPDGRRKQARRRRRTLGAVLLLGIVAIVVALTVPLAQRAVKELGLPLRYASTIRQQATAKHLDPALVAGVIYAETKFDPRTSPTGAEGPMQLEPGTALDLARRSGATTFTTADLNTPSINIAYGTYYLRELLNQYHDSTILALAAYNGGAANVDKWEQSAEAHGHTLRISDIPFPETREYVARVRSAQKAYRHTYPRQLGYG
jgi:soluble lytic murein transglycosylase